MLVCPIAAKAPSTIEPTEMAMTICFQSLAAAGKASWHHADQHGEGGDFRPGGEEGRHRRRRALIDVRRPHMERHGGELEGDARQEEHQAEDQADGALGACSTAAMPVKLVVPVKP